MPDSREGNRVVALLSPLFPPLPRIEALSAEGTLAAEGPLTLAAAEVAIIAVGQPAGIEPLPS